MSDQGRRVGRLKEKVVKRSVATFDWAMLEAHLATIALDADVVAELIGSLRRNGAFVIRRLDADRETARGAFVKELREFLAVDVGPDAASRLTDMLATISLIESGYREILRTLANVDAAKMLPEAQASAALSRAASNYHGLTRDLDIRTRRRKHVTLQGLRVTRDDGSTYSPDGILAGICQVTAMALHLLARREGWFDGRGHLVIPEPTETSPEEVYKAGLTEVLAVSWHHWERLEQRCRFFGGALVACHGEDIPDGMPAGTETFVAYGPVTGSEILDYVANQRLNDQVVQNFQEMLSETDMSTRTSGLAASPDLPPGTFVSRQEAHAGVALSQTLGYSIVDDHETPCGLRILEWVRGYSVLQALARAEYGARGQDGLNLRIERPTLVATLERLGLRDGKAELFVDLASLHVSSRDLFDQPLIRVRDGSLLLFGPGALDADPSRQTLSAIAAKGEALGRKGKAFERHMLGFFRSRGLDATAARFRVHGEEFEYDLLVPWGGYLFLFECKNKALSAHDPASAYHFALEMEAAKVQVRRLVDGLSRHADTVLERTGIDVRGMTLVPCVLNSLPYATEGQEDGVHVVDASAIRRFFQERHFHLIRPHRLAGDANLLHRTAVKSFWSGEEPTAADFAAYLGDLPQLRIALAHTEPLRHGFGLGERTFVVVDDLANKEPSAESVAESFSVDPRWVEREADGVTRMAKRLRRRLERRAIVEADRAWRRRR